MHEVDASHALMDPFPAFEQTMTTCKMHTCQKNQLQSVLTMEFKIYANRQQIYQMQAGHRMSSAARVGPP